MTLKSSHYKWMVGVGVAGAITVSLTFLEQRRVGARATVVTSSPSSNPNADRIHELKALEQDLQKKPEHPPILFRMAQLSTEMGKTADAISYLQRLLKADAGNTEARLELGRLLYQTNDVPGAIRENVEDSGDQSEARGCALQSGSHLRQSKSTRVGAHVLESSGGKRARIRERKARGGWSTEVGLSSGFSRSSVSYSSPDPSSEPDWPEPPEPSSPDPSSEPE